MAKYILIENESDFIFLANMFDRAMNKIKNNASKFDLDQAEIIVRINESLTKPINFDEINISQDTPNNQSKDTKKRLSSNPKSTRKAKSVPKIRLNLCEKHPYYGAVRSPQHDCTSCWDAYKGLNPNAYEKKRRDFERKMAKQNNG